MGEDERKAVDVVLGQLRAAIESAPPLAHSVEAERLMLAAYRVGVNDEARYLLGYEVVQLLLARVESFIVLSRSKPSD